MTTIQVAQTAGFTLGTYPLITGATGISASSFAVTGTPARYTGNLSVSGNVLNLVVTDTTPPVITVPANITSTDPVVSFTVTAQDAISGSVVPVCTPASGSTFPVGTTTIQCTATDGSGNQSSASFTVTVTSPASVANRAMRFLPASLALTAGLTALRAESHSYDNYFILASLCHLWIDQRYVLNAWRRVLLSIHSPPSDIRLVMFRGNSPTRAAG